MSPFSLVSAQDTLCWRQTWRLSVALLLCCVVACGQSNQLGGSMGTVFPLDFTAISITVQGTDLVVQYTSGPDVVCGVVINTSVGGLGDGAVLSGKRLVQAVNLIRADAFGGSFAGVSAGVLTLNTYATTPGQLVAGSFNLTLVDGNTLVGTFEGPILAVAS